MIDIATHIRIFNPTPSDDLVVKRTTAIKLLSSRLNRLRNLKPIFQWVNDLAQAIDVDGELSETLESKIELAIRNSARAFVAEEENLQITVCALLTSLYQLESKQQKKNLGIKNAIAISLWSALSYQVPRNETKLEALRAELLQRAQKTALHGATLSRQRTEVPNIDSSALNNDDPTSLDEALEHSTNCSIAALRKNALLDQEEINLLWWVLSDWSELFDCRFSNLKNPATKVVAIGLEAGNLLAEVPADAHRHLVLRSVDDTKSVSLSELLQELGDDRECLIDVYRENHLVKEFPAIFPLLTALQLGSATGASADFKRPLRNGLDAHYWKALLRV